MKNLKNKKRRSAILIAFLLTFVSGSAFAFATGYIDINGNVILTPPDADYVRWSSFDPGTHFGGLMIPDAPGLLGTWNAQHNGITIVDVPGRINNETNQRIIWNMTFYGEGFAGIGATATNFSPTLPADVTIRPGVSGNGYTWSGIPAGFTAEDFGLSVFLQGALYSGVVLAPGSSENVSVTVMWNGQFPTGFDLPAGSTYLDGISLIIEFDYIPA